MALEHAWIPGRTRGGRSRWRWRAWRTLLAEGRSPLAQGADDTNARQAGVGAVAGNATGNATADAGFERFVHQHERQILNFLWRMTGEEETAHDLTQEVFLRAWQHYDTIRHYELPRAWLFRVATNLALTYQRRRSAPVGAAIPLDEENSPATSDPAWRLAESDHVRQTLLRMAPRQRAALVLREVYGLSGTEVARALGISETAVKMTLWRGREQFRAIYLRGERPS
ncbi:MAG: RNA polymerase sigma factor [Ktedonobacterales bacterium]|nr:RNA polymerase sigma factor [Ktedonobacterales bacterium]